MKTESYYTPEEEAMALRVMGEAVDYFFRDAIAHYSDRQRLAVDAAAVAAVRQHRKQI